MSMEAQNLRFVRCPKCLQLLVEYPSIPVYQCGGCGTILRAKNRGAPVTQPDSVSGEQNNFRRSSEGSPQTSKSICSDELKVVSADMQPSENVVEGNISSVGKHAVSCENVNGERTMPVGESAASGEVDGEENCSLSVGNARNPEFMIEEPDGKSTAANSSMKLIENVQGVEISEDADGEKGYVMDVANDANVASEAAAVHSIAGEELGDDSSNNVIREIESMAEEKNSADNKNMNCHEAAEINKLYEEDGAKSINMVGQREERLQPYEGLCIESYEDLIEELERSLSLSDDEEDFSDVADNNGLNDALHNQIGSRRILSGGKMDDSPRSDPHGRLIEELERYFSDPEEPLEHHTAVVDKDIQDKIHVKEHDKDPQFLVNESANAFSDADEQSEHHIGVADKDTQEKIHVKEHDKNPQFLVNESANACADGKYVQSEQNFEKNELTAYGTKELEEGWTGDDNKIACVHGNEHFVLTYTDSPATIHENEIDRDAQYLDTESAKPYEESISSFGDRRLKCGQSFQQNELTTEVPKEKEDGCIEDDNKINCFHANEHAMVTDKDIAETVHENEHEHDKDRRYLGTESANLCKEDISSFDDEHLKSGESFDQHEVTSNGTEEKKQGRAEDDNTTICVQADNPVADAGFSSLSNERINCKSTSFTKKKEEISCRYRDSLLRQGLSLDSEDFRSIQNFIESQMDGTSSSLSSGSPSQGDLMIKTSSKFKTVDQLERLKKMDGLRDQLNRLSSHKGLEKRYQKKDLEYQPQQLNTYDVEQQFRSVDTDSIPSSCTLDSYYGHGKPPRYPPPNPFSPPHSCAHCHFGHVQAHIPQSFDAWEFNSYYQSSQAGSSIPDHDSLKSSFKEQKRVVRKHILRPLSGASPYTVCNSCFFLVQMPSDIYMSKRKIGKMQCGKCSKVIVLSVPAVNYAGANTSKELTEKSSKADNRKVARTESASYPVSVSEEYGASFTRSLFTRAGPSLAGTQSSKKVSDSALHLLMGYDSASQLLRHSRALERRSRVFDDGYESFESMVPVSNRVSRRKNM
ncbi:hypothetical protein D1007_58335 [Hordeum vulgare]|uniref:Zinc-ribbon domain-containing protein n=1 Tax=Hordeum vulgare subsp. vulgare TaxID=112509 RepID=A0A8I6YEY8_HORVV|nr:uncharacterized protein LOC123448074 [Hordeum vulgare subsp. vulgare]KAE8769986.1 hypothetical protein D1007_58335 [Hordeum vulgare]